MPIARATIDLLAAQLAPGAALLLSTLPPSVPAPAGHDPARLATWLVGLDDDQQRAVVDLLPASALVATARRELAGPAPVVVAAVAPIASPIATILGVANVDREPVLQRFASLRDSDMRLFVVTGAAGVGKSRAAELLQLFAEEHLGDGHRVIAIDLAEKRSLEAVVMAIRGELGVKLEVPTFAESNTTPMQWAKIVATAVMTGIRTALGPTVTPWLVFDHYQRMPPAEDDAGATFLAELALVVARARKQAGAPRVVFIDHDVPGPVGKFTERLELDRVGRDDVAAFLVRRDQLDDAKALVRADELIARARAECAQLGDAHEVQFMAFLADALEHA